MIANAPWQYEGAPRLQNLLRAVFSPGNIIAFVFGLALLLLLASITNIRRVLLLVVQFPEGLVPAVVALFILYEAVKFSQWYFLLSMLTPGVPWRKALLAFAGGEATRAVPGSAYFQAYLLDQLRGPGFALSAAVTTAMMGFEIAVTLTLLMLLGIDQWGWVKPVIFGSMVLFAVLALAFRRTSLPLIARIALPNPVGRYRRELLDGIRVFMIGLRDLLTLKALVGGFGLALCYLVVAALALQLISLGIAPGSVKVLETVSVYAFAVLASLLSPVPFDIGITEGSGLAAFVAYGMRRDEALATMITLRVLSSLTPLVFAVIVALSLWREWRGRAPNQEKPQKGPDKP